jgi:hypothetical protein
MFLPSRSAHQPSNFVFFRNQTRKVPRVFRADRFHLTVQMEWQTMTETSSNDSPFPGTFFLHKSKSVERYKPESSKADQQALTLAEMSIHFRLNPTSKKQLEPFFSIPNRFISEEKKHVHTSPFFPHSHLPLQKKTKKKKNSVFFTSPPPMTGPISIKQGDWKFVEADATNGAILGRGAFGDVFLGNRRRLIPGGTEKMSQMGALAVKNAPRKRHSPATKRANPSG